VAGLDEPGPVGVDASTHYAYVADGPIVSVISGGTVIGTIGTGSGNIATGLAVDPTTHTAYVLDFGQGKIWMIDGAVNPPALTRAVDTDGSIFPGGITVDPSTHTAYVIDGGDNSVTVIGPPAVTTSTLPAAAAGAPFPA
jgi:DNA-binding beta-propeller fold protein YncE